MLDNSSDRLTTGIIVATLIVGSSMPEAVFPRDFSQTKFCQSVFLHRELQNHFPRAKHGHIWPLVIYDHSIPLIHPSSIGLYIKLLF